jgi:LysR family transcriptional activator of glutamate synthase operon
MDIHHLKVFRAAAHSLSFTAAGREVSLSQSTISLHIKQLEEEFGCILFLRSRKRVVLTDAGRVLLQYVDRIFAELKNAELAVLEFSANRRGMIRLGVGASTLIYLLPRILADYRRKYPLIEIVVKTAVTEVLLQELINQTIDMAIVMSPSSALDFVEAIPLMTEELVIVLPPQHPLAVKAVLLPKDLDELVFISHLSETAMKTVQQAYFDRLGVQPRIAMEMENMEAIKSLVSAGMGASLLPLCCVSGIHAQDIVQKRVKGIRMSRSLLLAAMDWRAQPPATQRLARRLVHTLGSSEDLSVAIAAIDSVNRHD